MSIYIGKNVKQRYHNSKKNVKKNTDSEQQTLIIIQAFTTCLGL